MNISNFLETIFDVGDLTCYADNAHGYRVYDAPAPRDVYFCINALAPVDREPSKPWHDANVGRRADINVTRYTTFLLEIDNMPLDEQVEYVTSKIPVTAITFSGSKSNHFLIRLETPVSADEYKKIAAQLHKLLPKIDPSTKNASRLSRLPFRTRPETGLEQKLVYLGSRIPNAELLKKLPPVETKVYNGPKTPQSQFVAVQLMQALLSPDEVIQEKNLGGRNKFFYWLYHRMKEAELSLEKQQEYCDIAYSNLRDKSGFSINEAYMAARLK